LKKILIIDNLFAPNKKGSISNGAQKFAINQFHLLNREYDTYIVTAAGSDHQWANQFVLNEFFDLSLDRPDKVAQTKRISQEIDKIVKQVQPDYVLDSSCKHMSTIWDKYPVGVIFEHYHKSSAPLSEDGNEKFNKKGVTWCGVSQWQNKEFRNLFDAVLNIHYINEPPKEVKPAEKYGIFVSRWDGGKSPHVMLKNYLRSGANIPVKCYIKMGGTEIPQKELNNLMASDLLEFHIDAPRQEILDAMASAAFGMGSGHESTGIVCLEYVSHGVPYIVAGNKVVAEMEHLPADSIYLADRSLDESIPEQIKKHIDKCLEWDYNSRKQLSERVCVMYNADNFIDRHKDLLKKAEAKKNGNVSTLPI